MMVARTADGNEVVQDILIPETFIGEMMYFPGLFLTHDTQTAVNLQSFGSLRFPFL